MNNTKIRKEIFKEINDRAIWIFHIKRALFYGKKLAKLLGVDNEVVELGILLHDADGIFLYTKNDFAGSKTVASKLLSKYGYSQEIIEIVLNCISSHSSSSESKPINIIAKIVCDADALSHFEMLQFYYVSYTNPDLRFIDVLNKVYEKIEKSWAKIQLEESRALGKNKYRQVIRQLDFVRGVLKSK